MGFFEKLFGGSKGHKVTSGNKQIQDLLDLLDRMRVSSLQVDGNSDMSRLLAAVKMLELVDPSSKETFIQKGFELARSTDRFERMKAFQLLILWVNEDSRVDKSLEDGTFDGLM